jgi:hypothetical protein
MATILTKYVNESVYITIDFSDLLLTGTIALINSIKVYLRDGTENTDIVISNSSILSDSQSIQCLVTGGVFNYTYRIVASITTADSQIVEGDGLITIGR